MKTWRGWVDLLWMIPLALLLLPMVLVARLMDHEEEKKARKREGRCVKCGHAHTKPLTFSTDAHGWRGMRRCAG